jgi:hypothetical protein
LAVLITLQGIGEFSWLLWLPAKEMMYFLRHFCKPPRRLCIFLAVYTNRQRNGAFVNFGEPAK